MPAGPRGSRFTVSEAARYAVAMRPEIAASNSKLRLAPDVCKHCTHAACPDGTDVGTYVLCSGRGGPVSSGPVAAQRRPGTPGCGFAGRVGFGDVPGRRGE